VPLPQGRRTPEEPPAPAGAGAPVEIVFSNFQGSGEVSVHLDAMVEEFERQNPDIKIKLETVGYNDYFTQLQTRIAGGKAPDCFDLNYENFVSYAKRVCCLI
jgi:multiple sugar transport system substrate-binding protein